MTDTVRRRKTKKESQRNGKQKVVEQPARRNLRYIIMMVSVVLSILIPYTLGFTPISLLRSALLTGEPDNLTIDDPFVVVDVPGKGKGAIATRDIEQGEMVIREIPLFTVPTSIKGDPLKLLKENIRALTRSQKEAYYALSHHATMKGNSTQFENDKKLSILQTNAINAGPDHVGIFPRTARLNHGCVSVFNCVYSWRQDEGVLVVHALKPIKKGEDLLTVYFNTRQSRAVRKAYLEDNYHFTCTCAACTMSSEQVRISDERIATINTLYGRFADWQNGGIEGDEASRIVNVIWRLGEDEGYWSERGQLASDMAHVAAAHSDPEATVSWAKLSEQWFSYEVGRDSIHTKLMRQVIRDPRSHWNWGTRNSTKVGHPQV